MKLKIAIECEVDREGNFVGDLTFSAKSCLKGPVLRPSFLETKMQPSIELIKLTFDLDRMRDESAARTSATAAKKVTHAPVMRATRGRYER